MAQVLAGFRPVRHLTGAPYNGQVGRYMVSASDAQAIDVGDLVTLASATDPILDPITGGVFPAVIRAATTTVVAIVGAVVGFEPDYTNLNASNYRAASTRRVVLVADSPDLIFEAPQSATVGAQIAAASVGLNVTLVTGTVSTTGNVASTMQVSSGSVTTTSTSPLKLVGVTASPDNNDLTSAATRSAAVLVMINTHQFAPSTAGA
jgi:hypothetical protein